MRNTLLAITMILSSTAMAAAKKPAIEVLVLECNKPAGESAQSFKLLQTGGKFSVREAKFGSGHEVDAVPAQFSKSRNCYRWISALDGQVQICNSDGSKYWMYTSKLGDFQNTSEIDCN